jgi:hypothetical protein
MRATRASNDNSDDAKDAGSDRKCVTWTLAATLLALAGGCGPELDPPSLIEHTRVVGARVEVTGAPERATPAPGETATVSWLVTAPADMPPLGWAFVLCPGAGGRQDVCGEPLAVFQGSDARPTMTIAVPAQAALGQTRELVLYGQICSASEPVLKSDADGERPGCSMNGDGTTAAVTIPLQMGSMANRNPSLAASEMLFDGAAWAAEGATGAGAACAGLPAVAAGSKDHVIRYTTAASDQERFTELRGDPPVPVEQRERLQISHFTTAGELARSFSTVEAEETSDRPALEVKWEAPAADKVPAEGLVVRFTFVARDLRGGTDWTGRAVCVTE